MADIQVSGFQECETAIALPKAAVAEFCDRWEIDELYLFGSILRDDFRPDSDMDTILCCDMEIEHYSA